MVCTGHLAQVDDDIYDLVKDYHWCFDGQAVYRTIKKKVIYLHKFIFGADEGCGYIVDHKDTNPLNNQRSNLRKATYAENSYNTKKMNTRPTTSKYKGVYKRGNKFRAMIQHDGKKMNIGSFSCENEAALAYNEKAKEFFGEFAYLNEVTHA